MKVGYAFVVGDLLHCGHLVFLERCKQHCDFLIVGVYSDELSCVYKRKPIIPFIQRIRMVAALKAVDMVVKVENKDCTPMLKKLTAEGWKIDYLFHGDDWKNVKGKDYIESIGGKLIQPPYKHPYGVNTTKIISKIRYRYYRGKLKVLILCARQSFSKAREIFPNRSVIKALWKVGGERIIDRQIRLLRDKGITDITIIYSESTKAIKDQVKGVKYFEVKHKTNKCNDILECKKLFEKGTMILLGDVFFTRKGLNRILSVPVKDILWVRARRHGMFESILLIVNGIGAAKLRKFKPGVPAPPLWSIKEKLSPVPQMLTFNKGVFDIDYPEDIANAERLIKLEEVE